MTGRAKPGWAGPGRAEPLTVSLVFSKQLTVVVTVSRDVRDINTPASR